MGTFGPRRRWVSQAGIAVLGATALAAGLQFSASAATPHRATPIRPAPTSASLRARMYSAADPYSPTYKHPYRFGAVPTTRQLVQMRSWAITHLGATPALSASDLAFGGGIDGIGVTTGAEKVYLVFWGTQWGTESTNASGDATFSNDPSSAAPYLQELFKGLGTGNELWSGVMTQYCEGVATGAMTCPSSNQFHVAYPTGGALAGVWYDNSAPTPAASTPAQIGQEAINAASHFGNTTAALNRDAQYDIISPTGADPDSYKTGGFLTRTRQAAGPTRPARRPATYARGRPALAHPLPTCPSPPAPSRCSPPGATTARTAATASSPTRSSPMAAVAAATP